MPQNAYSTNPPQPFWSADGFPIGTTELAQAPPIAAGNQFYAMQDLSSGWEASFGELPSGLQSLVQSNVFMGEQGSANWLASQDIFQLLGQQGHFPAQAPFAAPAATAVPPPLFWPQGHGVPPVDPYNLAQDLY